MSKLKDETEESNKLYLPELCFCAIFIGAKGCGEIWSLLHY